MKIKTKLSLRKIADEYIMVTDTGHSLDYSQAIALNETAAYLIEEVGEESFDSERLIQLLLNRYDVTREQAQADVASLVASLVQAGVVEP